MDLTQLLSKPRLNAIERAWARRYLRKLAREIVAELERINDATMAEVFTDGGDFQASVERIAALRKQGEKQRRRLADIQHLAGSLALKRAEAMGGDVMREFEERIEQQIGRPVDWESVREDAATGG